jgi:hypothetical protein
MDAWLERYLQVRLARGEAMEDKIGSHDLEPTLPHIYRQVGWESGMYENKWQSSRRRDESGDQCSNCTCSVHMNVKEMKHLAGLLPDAQTLTSVTIDHRVRQWARISQAITADDHTVQSKTTILLTTYEHDAALTGNTPQCVKHALRSRQVRRDWRT